MKGYMGPSPESIENRCAMRGCAIGLVPGGVTMALFGDYVITVLALLMLLYAGVLYIASHAGEKGGESS